MFGGNLITAQIKHTGNICFSASGIVSSFYSTEVVGRKEEWTFFNIQFHFFSGQYRKTLTVTEAVSDVLSGFIDRANFQHQHLYRL